MSSPGPALLWLVLSLLPTLPTAAKADTGEARVHFEQGRVAIAEGRLMDARAHLRAAYELFPHRATAFNLLVALRGLERPSEATPLCRALLAGEHGTLGDAEAHQVRAVCDSVEEQWAHVSITITGTDRASIAIDGRGVGEVVRGDAFEHSLDPGPHMISVTAAGHGGEERRVVLTRGESLRIDVPVVPLMALPTELANAPDDSGSLGWLLGIGGAVLVGVALVIAIVASSGGGANPTPSEWSPDGPLHGLAP